MTPLRISVSLCFLVSFVLFSGAAYAAVDTVNGAAGANGVQGAAGDPGDPGTDGAAGDDAVANATTVNTDASNTATANAGRGGSGGRGGTGSVPGADGGDGGLGAKGGDADATASTTVTAGSASSTTNATGGAGGAGAAGGTPGAGGTSGLGGHAGAGGDANVTGESVNNGGGSATANATVTGGTGGNASSPDANGGSGGAASLTSVNATSNGGSVTANGTARGGRGGNAEGNGTAGDGAAVVLNNAVTGSTSGSLTLFQRTDGGHGGNVKDGLAGVAGNSSSTLSKAGSGSNVFLRADSHAGDGGITTSAAGTAASGGAATASVTVSNDAGIARSFTDARGGIGGQGIGGANAGDGGNSTATGVASTTGGGNTVDVDSFAWFDNRGGHVTSGVAGAKTGRGGDSDSSSSGTASGSSTVIVRDEARAGTGGDVNSGIGSGSAGGDASSTSIGSNVGSLSVTVNGQAHGGQGGNGRGAGESSGNGGAGDLVSVTGTSTTGSLSVTGTESGGGGGTGNTSADGGDGADSTVLNAVSGSTAGNMTISQTANAGEGGDSSGGTAGNAGNASSSFTSVSADGGTTTGNSTAKGGKGGDGLAAGTDGTDGGTAAAAIAITDTASVTANATATAGAGGTATGSKAGDGGTVSLGVDAVGVSGTSTGGGSVTVKGVGNGGNGGAATGSADAGSGGDVNLVNKVDGTTSGNLTLTQNALAGDSGSVRDGANGTAGNATSSLTNADSNNNNTVFIDAFGGHGGTRTSAAGKAADGGTGTVSANASNSAGIARVNADGRGGNGGSGSGGADGGDGGNATADGQASTTGDGNTVDVDTLAHNSGRGTGGAINSGSGSQAGNGGDSTSTSTGSAAGNSIVNVNDQSRAGPGGNVNSGTGSGGTGGNASSMAAGDNNGGNSVTVVNLAVGGAGGNGRGVGEQSGDGGTGSVVSTTGTSTGGGTVSVTTTQTGGAGGNGASSASGGAGANSSLINAVSGTTSGSLFLTQTTNGGKGGNSSGSTTGLAGNASSSFIVNSSDGGNAQGTSNANGGHGGSALVAGSDGSDGGSAATAAELTDSGTVTVNTRAVGGNGGTAAGSQAGHGGGVALGVGATGVSGESTSNGTVTVAGRGDGGNGGAATGAADAGNGADVNFANKVGGTTTGNQTLNQNAYAGNSGTVQNGANGAAGNATSNLTNNQSAALNSLAVDAFGGNGGTRTSAAGKAADGGTGTANSNAINDAGTARVNTDGRGGVGGPGTNGADGGDGGQATANGQASTTGNGNSVDVDTFAWLSGSGGAVNNGNSSQAGRGGHSTSTSDGTAAGNSSVNVRDEARAGRGGHVNSGTGSGGDGGNANSMSTGTINGSISAVVSSLSIAGTGGNGRGAGETSGNGGTASIVSATGTNTGDGSVSVTATQTGGGGGNGISGADGGDGADSDLVNVVSGATTGSLTLAQTANAGRAGHSNGGDTGQAGNASSSLTANNNDGGNVTGTSNANGGFGGNGQAAGGDGTDGGSASAANVLVDSGAINVTANVTAGNGGSAIGSKAGNGGTVALEVGGAGVSGESTGDDTVNVTATGRGGHGGTATGAADAGSGANVNFVDQVHATTAGNQTLTQNAYAGNSGTVQNGANGVAGNATSTLTKNTSTSNTTVFLDGYGGIGGSRTSAAGMAAGGGNGTATATVSNTDGISRVHVDARGGGGGVGSNGADGGNAGMATATGTASTTGDDNSVDVDVFASFSSSGGGVNNGSGGQAGLGGMSTGTGTGTAADNSTVNVHVDTDGSTGGHINSGTGSGGMGGMGTATATGSNALTSTRSVTVNANGRGGNGGNGRGAGENGGDGGMGTATATGTGGAAVSVTATATGGTRGNAFTGADLGMGGNATALATGTGTSGIVTATGNMGQSNGALVNDLQSKAVAQVASTSSSKAQAMNTGAGFDTSVANGQQSVSVNYAAPGSAISLPLVDANPVFANFDIPGVLGAHTINNSTQFDSDIFSVGVLGGAYSADGSSVKTYTSTVDMDVDLGQLQAGNQNLLIGFMSPNVSNEALTDDDFKVRFRVIKENVTVEDQTFTDAAAANAYFDSKTLDLGAVNGGVSGDLDLKMMLEVTVGDAGSSFAFDYISGNSVEVLRAVPNVPVTDFGIPDQHVGDIVFESVTVENKAAAGSDGANAIFSGTSGDGTHNGGVINNLPPGGSDLTTMKVGVDSSTAGAKLGTATLQLSTDGAVTGTQEVFGTAKTITSGDVFRLADPSDHTPEPVLLPNVRVGDVSEQALTLSNDAQDDGFSENLNAGFSGTTGDVNAIGNINQLGPETTDSTSLVVSIDTSSTGFKVGTASLALESDGTGINSLGITALPGQTVNVGGNVFRLAEAGPHRPEPVIFGDHHLNHAVDMTLSITNIAANDGFSESLNASTGVTTGDATTSGAFSLLAPGDTDNSNLLVGLDTTSVGNKEGTVTLNLESDGTGTSEILPNVALPDQIVNLTGTVYRLAAASDHLPEPVGFGELHVGDPANQALTFSNEAAADGFSERLNVSVSGVTGDANAAGAVVQLGAGSTDNSSITVGINTATAGVKAGTAELAIGSDGDGINSLNQTALPGQTVNLSGTVFRLANPTDHTPEPVIFDDRHVGDGANQSLTITNDVTPDGFSESLNVSISGTSGDVAASGGISLLGAGITDGSSINLSIDTATAGHKAGTATLGLESDGSGVNGLAVTALPDQTVNASGDVFRLAQSAPVSPNPLDLGDWHLGDTASQTLTLANVAVADSFSENLHATIGGITGDAIASGSVNQLAPGDIDNTSINAGVDTGTVGHKAGTVTIENQSDGDGINTLGQFGLADQVVDVQGSVYRLASADPVTPNPLDFGNHHVSHAVAGQALSFSNLSINDGFSESLDAGFGATTGGVIGAGSFTSLAPEDTDSSSLEVTIDTSTAGDKSGTAEVKLNSNGDGLNSLGLTALTTQTVDVTGAAFRLADVVVDNPLDFTFGNVHNGDVVNRFISLTNQALPDGFSEAGNVSFGGVSDSKINVNGGSVSLLAPGATDNTSMSIGLDTSTDGVISGSVMLNVESDGTGSSGLGTTLLPDIDISVAANITSVVFNLAVPVIQNPLLDFGILRVDNVVTPQDINILNDAPDSGFSEGLNATTNGVTGGVVHNGGSFDLLAAQDTNFGSIQVGLGTSVAGDRSGAANIQFTSDGTGTSGLGQTPLASQQVDVIAEVYRLADAGPLATGLLNVGDHHVSHTFFNNLSAPNVASNDGFSESLNGAFSGATGDVTGAGGFTLLAPGDTSSNLQIGIDTTTAGFKHGIATFGFESDGTGTSDIVGNVVLANQEVEAIGNVFRFAETGVPGPVVLGDQHVGDSLSQALAFENLAVNDFFSERLNVNVGGQTGDAQGVGGFTGLAAGQLDDSSVSVGVDTSSAGTKSGAVTISPESDGVGINDLGSSALPEFDVGVSGDVYNLASPGGLFPSQVDFGNLHIDDAPAQGIDLSNLVPDTVYSENLNAQVGTVTGDAIGSGGFTQLAPGDTNNGAIQVGLDTSSTGVKFGFVSVDIESDGTGINLLGTTALTGGEVEVRGTVFGLGEARINNPGDFQFGNVHRGDQPGAELSITNIAPDGGFSEGVNITFDSISSTSINHNGVGIDLLGAQQTDSTSMRVTVDTTTIGNVSGDVGINIESTGDGTSGLGLTSLSGQSFSVFATTFELAKPEIQNTDPVDLGSFRVGDTVTPEGLLIRNNADSVFGESLNAAAAGATGDALNNGASFDLLAPQDTDPGTINVSIETTTSGVKIGSTTIDFVSDGAGTSDLGQTPLPSLDIGVTAKVYDPAIASVTDPSKVDFGRVRVGDIVPDIMRQVDNIATGALTDDLLASFDPVPSPFAADPGGLAIGVAAGDGTQVSFGLDTSSAGEFTQSADLRFSSHNSDMDDLLLNTVMFDLMGIVNELANPVYNKTAGDGSLSGGGLSFLLDFGNVQEGSTQALETMVNIENDIFAPADNLSGSFFDEENLGGIFSFMDFAPISDIAAGLASQVMKVSFDPSSLLAGNFLGEIMFTPVSTYAGLNDIFLPDIRLVVQGQVVSSTSLPVPEPGTISLMIFGLIVLLRRKWGEQ